MKPQKKAKPMSDRWINGKPWKATKKDIDSSWGSRGFRCTLCHFKFKEGDIVRWQHTNDTPLAGGNPLLCVNCDGSKKDIVADMKLINKSHFQLFRMVKKHQAQALFPQSNEKDVKDV